MDSHVHKKTTAWDTKKLFGNKLILVLAGVLLFLATFSVSFILNLRSLRQQKSTSPQQSTQSFPKITKIPPTPTPTPHPLPQGKREFTTSVSNKNGPQLNKGFIDPYDPKVSENQTISITSQDNTPVKSVSVTMKTDKGAKEYPMKLVEGTATNGRWEATWVVEDTHLYTYHTILQAVGEKGKSSVEIILR